MLHKEDGCTFTGTYGRLEDHLDDGCDYELAECVWKGCTEVIPRRYKSEHESVGGYRQVRCDICKEDFTFNEFQDHESNVYGCMYLEECANKCTIQQCIDADIMDTYRGVVQAKLRTLPSSTY